MRPTPCLYSVSVCVLVCHGQLFDPRLVGTWATKANSTLTGPSFYNPIIDRLIEPEHTGISYAFTQDGHFESAYYRAISDPTTPRCTQGILQWQHGTYIHLSNGSLSLNPLPVDGRQLLSDPCNTTYSVYTRFNQTELYERYEVYIDPYHNAWRLNLFTFDGSPTPAMYLAFRPPQMLPTTTLNPTATSTWSTQPTGAVSTISAATYLEEKGDQGFRLPPMVRKRSGDHSDQDDGHVRTLRVFWAGVVVVGIGAVLMLSSCVHTILRLM